MPRFFYIVIYINIRPIMDGLRKVNIYAIFLTLLITLDITTIVQSKSLNNEDASCLKCQEQIPNRFKRDATDIINSVKGLVTGILDSTWGHIGRAKQIPEEEVVVYGGGNDNQNTFVLDYEYDYQ